jgi:hypothetical protein
MIILKLTIWKKDKKVLTVPISQVPPIFKTENTVQIKNTINTIYPTFVENIIEPKENVLLHENQDNIIENDVQNEINNSIESSEIEPEEPFIMTEEETEKLILDFAENIYSNPLFINNNSYIEDRYDNIISSTTINNIAKSVVEKQDCSYSFLKNMFINPPRWYNVAELEEKLESIGVTCWSSYDYSVEKYNKKMLVNVKYVDDLDLIFKYGIKIPKFSRLKTPFKLFYEENKNKINEKIEEIKRIDEEKRKKEAEDKIQREKDEIKSKLLEKERKRQLQNEVLQELITDELIFVKRNKNEKNREPIPKDVMSQVWSRDGGCCVQCGSMENLEFDHIIPFSKGGATTYRNLQLLCRTCNASKSNNI